VGYQLCCEGKVLPGGDSGVDIKDERYSPEFKYTHALTEP